MQNQSVILDYYLYYLHKYYSDMQHPATVDYFFSKLYPFQFAAIVITYLLLVTRIIPYFMRNRQPFVLKWPILCYNTFMVIINFYFFIEALKRSHFGLLMFDFAYPDSQNVTAKNLDDLVVGYWYYCSKFLDWLDTFFFALRKKNSHISFLHLYHHSVVPSFGYLMLRINPFIPAMFLFGICNTFVHVIMYSYYALTVFGPKIQKYLWWKKYITQLQLGQFAIYVSYGILVIFKQTGYPPFWLYFAFTQPPFFLWMFYDFYRKAYDRRQSQMKKYSNGNSDKQMAAMNNYIKYKGS